MSIQEALIVLVTGIVVVFLVLILLTAIIKIYGTVIGGIFSKGNKPKGKEESKPAPKVAAPKAAAPKAAAPKAATTNGISQEVVAVIAAAVASMESETGLVITNIKKATSGANNRVSARSAWGSAGLMEATRPF